MPKIARGLSPRCVHLGFSALRDDLFKDDAAIVRFGVPPYRVEILQSISGVDFEQAYRHRVLWKHGETNIPVIGLDDLRRNKAAAGRLQDLADLDNLPPLST